MSLMTDHATITRATNTLNNISPKFFGHAINDRKLRHSSWKCNLCTHVQHQACAHNTDVADAKSSHNLNSSKTFSHASPHVLLLSLLFFFFLRTSHAEPLCAPSSSQEHSKSKWTAVQIADVDGFYKAPVVFRMSYYNVEVRSAESQSFLSTIYIYRQWKPQKP